MKSPKSGFALVIALSLMAFILLLLLSITTLVQVETTNSSFTKKQLIARQNAQLGAMIALGDLQKLAGPDQRVTARADVLASPNSATINGTAQWAGVWSSKLNDNGQPVNDTVDTQVGLNNHKPQWLVSGDFEDLKTVVDEDTLEITTAPDQDADNAITLVSKDVSVNVDEEEVVVFKERIQGKSNAKNGEFAYWVSDEGVKARINLANPYNDGGAIEESGYYSTATAQQADATTVRDRLDAQPFLDSGDTSIWKEQDSPVSKVVNYGSLPMIGVSGDQEAVKREFFHDFSTSSKSVLSNVKDGGLKQDLSLALLNPAANNLTGEMFSPAGTSATLYDPGGPRWLQLADHYKESIDNDAVEKSRDLSDAGEIDFKPFSNDGVSYQPVITRFHFHFHAIGENYRFLEYHQDNLEPDGSLIANPVGWKNPRLLGNYHFVVGYFPMITLWNPYDRDMVFSGDLGMEMSMGGVQLTANYDGYGTPNPDPVATIIQKSYMPKFSEPTNYGALYFTLRTRGLKIPAGRAINFSPPNHSIMNFTNGQDNVLVPGAGDTFVTGFYTDPNDTQTSIKVGDIDANGQPIATAPGTSDENRLWMTEKNAQDYPIYDEVITGVKTDVNITQYHVRLYSESFTSKPDEDTRFLSFTTGGTFFSHRDNAKTPRAIRLWAVTGGRTKDNGYGGANSNGNFQQFIGPKGASVGVDYGNGPGMEDGLSSFDLEVVEAQEKTINGIARYMNFPDADITGGSERGHILSQMNPRSPLMHDPAHKLLSNNLGNDNFHHDLMTVEARTSWSWDYSVGQLIRNYIVGMDGDNLEYGYVGMDVDSRRGSERMVLFEVPSQPPLGIGQFMHANLMNVGHISQTVDGKNWHYNLQQSAMTPSYAIGNSISSIFMPLDRTKTLVSGNSGVFSGLTGNFYASNANSFPGSHYDYSYELNDTLWDGFYLSTIIPDSSGVTPEFPADGVLPNSRIKPWKVGAVDDEVLESDKSAAHLMLDGGFNINSTSVAAWESILGALRDVETLGEDPVNDQLKHSFARTTSPLFESTKEIPDALSTSPTNQDVIVSGFRSLTDNQISDLANEIVDEIRTRRAVSGYPFLSLSDFINRSINSADISDSNRRRFAYMGALQFAIEQAGVNGPSAISKTWTRDAGQTDGLSVDRFITPEFPSKVAPFHEESLEVINSRSFFDAFPGALTQADVLSKIGAVLTPRSDTFTIRSYGASLDPITGKDQGKAYLEMTVQRLPEYVDSTDEAYESPSTVENNNFGRKFAVVSMRWLSADEI